MRTVPSFLLLVGILSLYVYGYYALLSAFGAVPDMTTIIVDMYEGLY